MKISARVWPHRRTVLSGVLTAAVLTALPGSAESCTAALPKEITFRVRRVPPNSDKPFSPYVSLSDPDSSIARLEGADDVVLACAAIMVLVEYPLRKEFEFPASTWETGFTRGELVRAVSAIYQHIYEEEEKTTRVPIIPPEKRVGMANRNRTDGTFGIWGHDLTDLDLRAIIPERRGSIVYVTLEIDS